MYLGSNRRLFQGRSQSARGCVVPAWVKPDIWFEFNLTSFLLSGERRRRPTHMCTPVEDEKGKSQFEMQEEVLYSKIPARTITKRARESKNTQVNQTDPEPDLPSNQNFVLKRQKKKRRRNRCCQNKRKKENKQRKLKRNKGSLNSRHRRRRTSPTLVGILPGERLQLSPSKHYRTEYSQQTRIPI